MYKRRNQIEMDVTGVRFGSVPVSCSLLPVVNQSPLIIGR